MKDHILSIALIFISSATYCQVKDNSAVVPTLQLTASKIVYTDFINIDSSVSKELLFHNAQEWYKHNYETADNTLIINDIETGKISGTGIIHDRKKEKQTDPGDLFFTIDIIAAKGVYQYRVYDIYSFENNSNKFYYSDMYNEYRYPPSKPRWPKPYKVLMLNNMNNRITAMITAMQADMAQR